MYQHFHQTNTESIIEEENISLHDCKATRMSLDDGALSFYFPDGFWVGRNGSDGRESDLSMEQYV